MRILIIADSLGCPRKQTPLGKTWTYRLIQKYNSESIYFFTMMRHGLHSGMIDYNLIKDLRPDLVICQFGIVECVRRAFPIWYTEFIRNIRYVRGIHHLISKKYHYLWTKVSNIHYVKIGAFKANVKHILDQAGDAKVFFIRIADPGEALTQIIYNCKNDVDRYNSVFKASDGIYLDPYVGYEAKDYILDEDGHHLTFLGHDLVFSLIDNIIDEVLNG